MVHSHDYRYNIVALGPFINILRRYNIYNNFVAPLLNLRLQNLIFPRHFQGSTLKDELRGVYRLLLSVDRVMAKYSPVIVIQRWIRGWLVRKALTKSSDPKIK